MSDGTPGLENGFAVAFVDTDLRDDAAYQEVPRTFGVLHVQRDDGGTLSRNSRRR